MLLPDIYVIRHGETVWNAEGRLQGRLDSPLTERGEMQALRVGALLAAHWPEGARIYSSPQGRALATARLATGRLPQPLAEIEIVTDPRLAEIDVGDWTGVTRPQMIAERPDLFDDDDPLGWYDRAPHGEGLAALAVRAEAFLNTLDGPAVIFTHGITSRVLRCLALSMPPRDIGKVDGGQGSIHWVRGGEAGSIL